jgi:predicted Fe-Mo cluster-binding NifX family protein
MKIAVVTDDHKTISAHFGRAQYYDVFTVEDNKVVKKEIREKANHRQFSGEDHHHGEHGDSHGMDPGSQRRHGLMMETIDDCQVLIARGMGQGAHNNLRERGIKPILTDIQQIQDALDAYLAGTLIENVDRVH